jgi:hypothetical protein
VPANINKNMITDLGKDLKMQEGEPEEGEALAEPSGGEEAGEKE